MRRFTPSDLDAVIQLFQEVVHSVGAKYYSQKQLDAWAPKEGLEREKWLERLREQITYLVEVEGRLVGFGGMTLRGDIDHLYVHQKFQGRGVALALFRKLEEEARALGLSELTTDASIIVKPLAQRQGFEVVKEHRKLHRGVEFTNYIMRKKL